MVGKVGGPRRHTTFTITIRNTKQRTIRITKLDITYYNQKAQGMLSDDSGMTEPPVVFYESDSIFYVMVDNF